MQIKTRFKFPLFALTMAGTLAGCVTLQWMVKYQDADKYYSSGTTTAIDTQGNSFLGGFVEPRNAGQEGRIAFVAKYDSKGTLLWDHRFTESSDYPVNGVSSLLTDADGSVYVSEVRKVSLPFASRLLVTKIDRFGNTLWQWYGNVGVVPWNMIRSEIRSDGNFYISSIPAASDLVELSPLGDLRWSILDVPQPPGLPGDINLGQFPAAVTVQSAAVVESGYSVRNIGSQVQLLNHDGGVLASFSLGQLSMTKVLRVFVRNGVIMLVGADATNVVMRRIVATDSGFALDEQHEFTLSSTALDVQAVSAGGLCFASIDSGNLVSTGFVDENLQLRWRHQIPSGAEVTEVALTKVEASSDHCYAQYYTAKPGQVVTHVVAEDILTGKPYSPVTVQDFYPYDLSVQASSVVQAGITGPSSGQDGVAATLTKHSVN